MDLQYFPNFLVAIFPMAKQFSNQEIAEVGTGFKSYLEEKFPEPTVKQLEFMNISPATVICRLYHPIYHKGYDPALVWHLTEFVRLQQEANKK